MVSTDVADMLMRFAEDFYRRAREGFSSAVSGGDAVGIGDSAEKAWNAVVQAINALLLSRHGKIPASHFERRKMLRDLEKADEDIRRLGLLDRYMARYRVLHGEAFYEGILDIEQLSLEMDRVRELIDDIKKILSR